MQTVQAKVSSKGQVTLPKPLRTKLSIRTGDRLEFEIDDADRIVLRKKRAPGSSAGCGRQFINPIHEPVSVEEMDVGIRKAIAQRYERSSNQK